MFLFGILDNGVLVLGLLAGFEWGELLLPKRWRSKSLGVAIGGLLGNAISDGVGCLPFINRSMTWADCGLVIAGCLSVLVVVPLLVKRLEVE